MTINPLGRSLAGAAALALCATSLQAESPLPQAEGPQLKVDFDMAGRQASEVNDPDYRPWPVPEGNTVSETFDGVTVTLRRHGDAGRALRSNWYKGGFDDEDARLVSDGVLVDFGDNEPRGGAISLTFSDLPGGEHSLLLYLNSVDNWADQSVAPLSLSVDGDVQQDEVEMTNRAERNSEGQTAYLNVYGEEGEDTEIVVAAQTGTGADIENVVINGFELNTPNRARQARTPAPANGDEHVNADDGRLTLDWEPGPDVVEHEVYFSSDAEAVSKGEDSAYVGNQGHTGVNLTNLHSGEEYFWRVDQVHDDDTLT